MNNDGRENGVTNSTYVHHGGRPAVTDEHGEPLKRPLEFGAYCNFRIGRGFTQIIVAEGVEFIEDYAFRSEWPDVKSVHISSTVQKIGGRAFCECTSLMEIHFAPNSQLQTISRFAFYRCRNLIKVELPDTVTDLDDAFVCCTSLSSIKVPPSITTIKSDTFTGCKSLMRMSIPSAAKKIESEAFRKCYQLTSIKFPNGLKGIGESTFNWCTQLQAIQLPPSIRYTSDCTFADCSSLKIIYVPSEAIGAYAFDSFFDEIPSPYQKIIFLTDIDGFQIQEYDGPAHPSLTLNSIRLCINEMPDDIPTSEQLSTLHQIFDQRHPVIAQLAKEYNFSLLHILIFIPGDIYQPLLTLLNKYPAVVTAKDCTGRTAFHHTISSTKHNMDTRSFNLLSERTPNSIVHLALQSEAPWPEVHEIVENKIGALEDTDEKSGLLPFMLAAAEAPNYDCDRGYIRRMDRLVGRFKSEEVHDTSSRYDGDDREDPVHLFFNLTAVFMLLSMQPDVLTEYVSTNTNVKKRRLDLVEG